MVLSVTVSTCQRITAIARFAVPYLLGTGVCCGIFFATLAAQKVKIKAVQATSDQELWHLDLRKTDPPLFADADERPQSLRDTASFDSTDFLTNHTLLYTNILHSPEHGLVRRADAKAPAPYRLTAAFIDAGTGKIAKQMEWALDAADAWIFPASDGGFVLFSTQEIVRYSAEGVRERELRSSDLPMPNSTIDGIVESPSHKKLALRIMIEKKQKCFEIDTVNLNHTEMPCENGYLFSISNDEIAELQLATANDTDEPSVQRSRGTIIARANRAILFRGSDGTQTKLCEAVLLGSYCYAPQFLDDDTIVAYNVSEVAVMDTHGNVKSRRDFDFEEPYLFVPSRPIRVSADGKRFALAFTGRVEAVVPDGRQGYQAANTLLSVLQASSQSPIAVRPAYVEVFDVASNEWFYTLKNRKSEWKEIDGLALSPDGTKMAVDSRGMLQVYALPASPSSSGKN